MLSHVPKEPHVKSCWKWKQEPAPRSARDCASVMALFPLLSNVDSALPVRVLTSAPALQVSSSGANCVLKK